MDIGRHPAANFTYKAPANMPDCQDLHVVRTKDGSASHWIPDAKEREAIRKGKAVMLMVYGYTHPPVSVGVDTSSGQQVEPDQDAKDAACWRKLVKLAGYCQNASDRSVKLHQDDATRQCLITAGNHTGFGPSFESALALLIEPEED